MKRASFLLCGIVSLVAPSVSNAQEPARPELAVELPAEIRKWFLNPPDYGGSCVQCSVGMCGVDQNVPAAAMLLWDTEYGRAERGGSGPSRARTHPAWEAGVVISPAIGAPSPRFHVASRTPATEAPLLDEDRPQLRLTATNSQALQVRFRLASARASRAVRRAASSDLGTSSPLPKYISSGVCPRNAECGRRVLCSST